MCFIFVCFCFLFCLRLEKVWRASCRDEKYQISSNWNWNPNSFCRNLRELIQFSIRLCSPDLGLLTMSFRTDDIVTMRHCVAPAGHSHWHLRRSQPHSPWGLPLAELMFLVSPVLKGAWLWQILSKMFGRFGWLVFWHFRKTDSDFTWRNNKAEHSLDSYLVCSKSITYKIHNLSTGSDVQEYI